MCTADAKTLRESLESLGSELVKLKDNLVDAIWVDRPARPKSRVFHLDEKYSGQSVKGKILQVREVLEKKTMQAVVITMLDEIAWLFNLRGSDIDFNPGSVKF